MARSAVSEFVRVLGDIDRSKHRDEVFRDFCELAYCALAKQASPFEDQRDALEAQYMDVVARYRSKDDVRRMPELLALAIPQISAGGSDFLGMVAGEIGALSAQLGQFFTPYEVSRLMVEMNFQGADQIIADKGFVTVCEPAAGAGGMLLAVADVIEAKGYPLETSVWIEATELSQSTYHMGYIQITARGLPGRGICGNSLSRETFTSAYTAAAPVFTARHGNPFAKEEAEAARRAAADAARAAQLQADRDARRQSLGDGPATTGGQQLSLF